MLCLKGGTYGYLRMLGMLFTFTESATNAVMQTATHTPRQPDRQRRRRKNRLKETTVWL